MDFKFTIGGQSLILVVQGPAIFYAIDVGPTEMPPDYRILGIADQTYGDKATENHSWASVRALFD